MNNRCNFTIHVRNTKQKRKCKNKAAFDFNDCRLCKLHSNVKFRSFVIKIQSAFRSHRCRVLLIKLRDLPIDLQNHIIGFIKNDFKEQRIYNQISNYLVKKFRNHIYFLNNNTFTDNNNNTLTDNNNNTLTDNNNNNTLTDNNNYYSNSIILANICNSLLDFSHIDYTINLLLKMQKYKILLNYNKNYTNSTTPYLKTWQSLNLASNRSLTSLKTLMEYIYNYCKRWYPNCIAHTNWSS